MRGARDRHRPGDPLSVGPSESWCDAGSLVRRELPRDRTRVPRYVPNYVALHDRPSGRIDFAYYYDSGQRRDEPSIVYGEGLTSQIIVSRTPLLLATIAANVGVAIQNARLFSEVERQRQYLESLVTISPAAVVVMDADERVTDWNPAAAELFGYSSEEAVGQTIEDPSSARRTR